MRILITGACGILGRAVRRIAAAEHELRLLDSADVVVADGGLCGSITDRELIDRAIAGCDAVVHAAAMHGGARGKESNARFIETNVLGAEYLFDAAIRFGVKRIIVASSMEILFGRGWGGYGTAVLDESFSPRPEWIYPVTKLQVEVLGSFYAQHHGLEVVQLRYMAFNDMSPEELGLRLLARYVTAADAARATLLAVTRPGLGDELIHIGPETPLAQKDVNEAQSDPRAVLERFWPGASDVLARRRIELNSSHFWPVTSILRAKRTLGWQPVDTFQQLLIMLGWRPQ